MAFEITQNTRFAVEKSGVEPQIIIEIDGVEKIYGSSSILKIVRIGDEDLFIDGTWTIGGSNPIKNQKSLISFGSGGGQGSSSKITQQLNTDTGESSGISSMQIVLIDKDLEISKLITPGLVVDDMLGRRVKIWLGFAGTNFKDDFVAIHRGIVDDIQSDPGSVTFNISHPDQKKRQEIFSIEKTSITALLNISAITVSVADASKFLVPITGPSGSIDADFETLIQIEDELIKYTGISGNDLTGCVRGYLGTAAVGHASGKEVEARFNLTGNCIKLAEKLMLSGWSGPCFENIKAERFVQVDASNNIANAVYIRSTNPGRDYGLSVGDFVTVSGAALGANNFSNRAILEIGQLSDGSYLIIDGSSFAVETDSAALLSIRSQFDVWPIGLRMVTDEVDVASHERIYRTFVSSFNYQFLIKDAITGKDFIEKQLFRPASLFTVPRNAQSSIGYHIGPIPGAETKTIDADTIRNASQLRVRRGLSKNFYNTVVYKFDKNLADSYRGGVIYTSQTSRDRIDIGTRPLVIESDGMRTSLFAFSSASIAASRRLNRYKFGAEYLDNVKVMFSEGYAIDVGDIVLADFSSLNVVNTKSGDRSPEIAFYEVQNKSLDIKTGEVSLSLTNTNFSTASRYALISPSSRIKSVADQKTIVIESSFSSIYGANEGLKWKRYIGENIRVRTYDYSQSEVGVIKSVSGNTIVFNENMGLPMSAGSYLELGLYNEVSTKINLLYGFMTDNVAFDDGKSQYKMI